MSDIYIKRLDEHEWWVQFGYKLKDSSIIRTLSAVHEDEFSDIFGGAALRLLTNQWEVFTITCTPKEGV